MNDDYLKWKAHSMYRDLKGEEVKRTRETHPYSYDPYVIWKQDYSENNACVYSDRLLQWDYDKYNKYCLEIWSNQGQYFNNREPQDTEKFLGLYLGRTIKLTAIMEGCNVSNGYPYWIFFYEQMK
jgi:hypothetical protein